MSDQAAVPAVPTTHPPSRRFLRKVTAAAAWGHGLDGYDLGVLSVALPFIATDLGASPTALGLLGAAALIGIFFGGLVFGWLTDKIGRKTTFTFVFALFIITSLLQLWTVAIATLFLVRVACGFTIGAEYAVGATMLAEFSPSHNRGRRVSFCQVCWYVGYLAAVVIAYALLELTVVHWTWVLASAAVPAVVGLLLRRGIPESPRWLVSRGRHKEAHTIVDRHLGGRDFFVEEGLDAEEVAKHRTSWVALFQGQQRRSTLFGAIMYVCLVIPYFAIFTFAPTVLSALNISNIAAGTIAINAVAVAGTVAGTLLVDRLGRRRLLIAPFWASAVALLVVGIWGGQAAAIVVICFVVFAFFNSAASILIPVYPNELFPTSMRSTGIGLLTAVSRIGAAIATFLLPVAIAGLGVGATMLIGALVCVLGAIVSQRIAPETARLNLSTTAHMSTRYLPVGEDTL